MDFPHDSAARASASEDGRRSGTRRKATRRVEAIHAQELVQDDARDACRASRRRHSEDALTLLEHVFPRLKYHTTEKTP